MRHAGHSPIFRYADFIAFIFEISQRHRYYFRSVALLARIWVLTILIITGQEQAVCQVINVCLK